MTLQFQLLGPLQVLSDNGVIPINGARQRVLLTRLLLAADHVVSVGLLSEAIWGERCPPSGRTQVAICVAGLRKAFRNAGHDRVIETAHPGYRLVTRDHRVDVIDFDRSVRSAREAVGKGDTAEAARLLTEALGLWRGSPLAGINGHVIEAEAVRLEEQRLLAIEQLAAIRLDQGDHTTVIGELMPVVSQYPLREQSRSYLMLAQYRSGQRADALETFRQGREQSIEELGLEPGPQLRDLHDAILRDDPLIDPAAETRSGDIPRQLPSNVPNFVGRAAELNALDALARERSRDQPVLIGTLSGAAGVGKSALSVHWAQRNADAFPDGQLFADLKGFSQEYPPVRPEVVLERFLRALGVPHEQIPEEPTERQALYHTVLSGRRVLVMLDNVHSFSQIQPLLPGSGTCCVIATSRRHLTELDGHAAVRLRLAPLQRDEAVELLNQVVGDERVAGDLDSASLVSDLCDRLPLALRSAGARLAARPHWTLRHLANRLGDERRRLDELSFNENAVRASFHLSYRQLSSQAQKMYRHLGLLHGPSFGAWDAATLLNTPVADADNVLETLVDAQLLTVVGRTADGRTQYGFQGLLRLFASELALADNCTEEQGTTCERKSAA